MDFATFYDVAWPRVLRTTYAVCGERQRAEDAAQTAFAQAYAVWSRVQRADDPMAYVRRIAVNAALAQGRLAFRRRELSRDVLPERAHEDDPLAHDEVWQAVRDLPPRQRAVIVLRYYDDLSERQIADVLRCRPGTVKSQASAALATLRVRLEEPALRGDHHGA
ncbi:unannotated protein [freshwater metagenome]|uniref:Unannotated protein n=1 Tax=freshwater metagenome TaxID=449393 RepID=A0A6J6SFF7_9ZZZZ